MSDKTEKNADTADSFVQRWSRLKHEQQQKVSAPASPQEAEPPQRSPVAEPAVVVCESELPPIESLDEDSEVGMFFGEGINEKIRQQALRKLFHFQKFNVVDGLDDYAEDYTIFQPLYHLYSSREEIQKLARKMTEPDDDKTGEQTSMQSEINSPAPQETIAMRDDDGDEAPPRKD